MKVLCGRGRITNLQIVFSTELQISFESRARMLGSLSFVTVRQEHHQSRSLFPLVFRSGDVLIDSRLLTVSKITKLRFPQIECVLRNHCVAVLESQHAFFGKRTVVDIETRVRVLFRA